MWDKNLKPLELQIFDILLTEQGFTVVLRTSEYPQKALSLLVGFADAHWLTVNFHKVRVREPIMTDIFQNLLTIFEMTTSHMMIYSLKDDYFLATLFLMGKKQKIAIETRISDALALIISGNGKIFISDQLFLKNASSYDFYEGKDEELKQYGILKLRELREKLNTALAEERYEDAQKIKKKLRNLFEGEEDV